MTKEMKKLLVSFIKTSILISALIFVVGIMFFEDVNIIFFMSSFIVFTINFILLGYSVEFVLNNRSNKVFLLIICKILLTMLILIITFKNIQYSVYIISGFILSLFLAILSLLIMQRKDV